MADSEKTEPKQPPARKKRPAKRPQKGAQAPQPDELRPDCPVIALGASAGGLDALQTFFTQIPPKTGYAFVVVTHLQKDRPSLLPDLIGQKTEMPVQTATDGIRLEPDNVYVAPPGLFLAIYHGVFHAMEPPMGERPHFPIDYFFRSLAADQEHRAIGIVLSGSGSDGSQGVREIKGKSGYTLAQAPGTAAYPDMPSHAIATGAIDSVLEIENMPESIRQICGRLQGMPPAPERKPEPNLYARIFALLRDRTGQDFSLYKYGTVGRRIERRVNLHQLPDLAAYVRYLQTNPHEVDLLFKELLIGVTSFFRDPEAFEHLKNGPLRQYLQTLRPDREIRVWVPGCSTGEEAYSIAIVLHELNAELNRHHPIQVFGTDLDHDAVDIARYGVYTEGIANDVDPKRLKRYFANQDSGWRIAKKIRDVVVFAVQNVVQDPPFIRLDLISCRNLLIYLTPELQDRVIPVFHFALNAGGILFLGSSETIGSHTDAFDTLDRKWKIYRRKEGVQLRAPITELRGNAAQRDETAETLPDALRDVGPAAIDKLVHERLLARFVPPGAVVDERGNIVYIHGRTGAYLEPAPGRPLLNIIDMARPGLKLDLSAALRKAATAADPVCFNDVNVQSNGGSVLVDLHVEPITEPARLRGLFHVTFRSKPAAAAADTGFESTESRERRDIVEAELTRTKEMLQSTVEELETANEELKATNEELQSTNEELQSTNEELETAKEETQSLNEELTTVNAKLQAKVDELSRARDEMEIILTLANTASVYLDRELRIERFNRRAAELMNLIPGDIGRPISDITTNLDYEGVEDDARQVLETLIVIEKQIRTNDGRWRLMRVELSRRQQHTIGGITISFVDIDAIKQSEIKGHLQSHYFQNIVETVREPLIVLDDGMRVVSANRSFYRTFKLTPRQVEGELLYEISQGEWDIPRLRALLSNVFKSDTPFEDFEVDHRFRRIGRRVLLLNARRLVEEESGRQYILLALEDVTRLSKETEDQPGA